MNDDVILKVNGMNYHGWIAIEIRESIRSLAGMFNLTVSDSWLAKRKPWFIVPGDYCELYIGKDQMITGYLDDLDYSVNANSREISFSGRDKTGDLVDCSVEGQFQWANLKLEALLNKICSPFGVKVINNAGINPDVKQFNCNPGDSPHDAIDELSKKYGFIASSNSEGNLVIVKVGDIRAVDALVEGVNFLDGSIKIDHKDRFSKYILKGKAAGSDESDGLHVSSIALDDGIKRYRPKVITTTSDSHETNLDKRSQWEKNLRESKSTAGSVSLKGWRQSNGSLWKKNMLVPFKSSYLGLDTEFLVGDITYTLNDQGRRVSMDLLRKEVFLSEISLAQAGVKKESPEAQLQKDFFK
jgi:prophage tail gpP-like protein